MSNMSYCRSLGTVAANLLHLLRNHREQQDQPFAHEVGDLIGRAQDRELETFALMNGFSTFENLRNALIGRTSAAWVYRMGL